MKILKILLTTLLLLAISLTQTTQSNADFGPKRNLEVTVVGLEGYYYFDLLVEVDEANIIEQELFDDMTNYFTYADEIPSFLNGYQDEDGFAAYTLYYPIGGGRINFREDSSTNTEKLFNVYYDVPNIFKVAIVTEEGYLVTSQIVETVYFDSSITFDLSDVDIKSNLSGVGTVRGDVKGDFPYGTMIFDITYRVILTLMIELLILFAFRYLKKASYIRVGIVNIITQLTLTIFLVVTFKYSGSLAAILLLFLGELLVFTIEAISYMIILKEHSKLRAFFYAMVANSVSFIISLLLLAFIL